jgi:hypothetical protein
VPGETRPAALLQPDWLRPVDLAQRLPGAGHPAAIDETVRRARAAYD